MELGELFERYGTDKARSGYADIYHDLLAPRRLLVTSVLEVGVGSLDPAAYSSMAGYAAAHYAPGGSLRAWRDYFPHAVVHGVDTQPDAMLHDEDRITTHLADSTCLDPGVLGDLTFDLIVDDGDHRETAQKLTYAQLWPRLRPGGIYVIEDAGAHHPGIGLIIITKHRELP